ncbi:hypothetical protein [Methylorubrum suomiense]|nr:hypothetical protein [Methylorubrum suomiense]
MPFSQKPRRKYAGRAVEPDYSSRAGQLISSFFDWGGRLFGAATVENAIRRDARAEKFDTRPKHKVIRPHAVRRRGRTVVGPEIVRYAPCAGPGSREALRRRGQKLTQHPSVIARFAEAA